MGTIRHSFRFKPRDVKKVRFVNFCRQWNKKSYVGTKKTIIFNSNHFNYIVNSAMSFFISNLSSCIHNLLEYFFSWI